MRLGVFGKLLVEGLCVRGCTDLEVRGARRFTFEELQGFVERAKACIPGTVEAIEAAARHRAHQVRSLTISLYWAYPSRRL